MEKIQILIRFLERKYGYPKVGGGSKFRLLIATVLSQRTRDENTHKAASQLFSVAQTPETISKLPLKKIEELIRPSGPYRQKAKRIKQISKILLEDHKGRVPMRRDELMELPGVGYKTADIVLSYGFGVPTIAVDTHVNRIPKRLGIIPEKANVEEVRKRLEKTVKGKKRFIVNLGLVRFGQQICRPVGPKCEECPLKKICKYYKEVVCNEKR